MAVVGNEVGMQDQLGIIFFQVQIPALNLSTEVCVVFVPRVHPQQQSRSLTMGEK